MAVHMFLSIIQCQARFFSQVIIDGLLKNLDSGFRRNDDGVSTFCEHI